MDGQQSNSSAPPYEPSGWPSEDSDPASASAAAARWRNPREQSVSPSEVSTPAATPSEYLLPGEVEHHRNGGATLSRGGSRDTAGGPSSAGPATPSAAAGGLTIDAEDEDVKIAIMALGAMRSLDGRSSSSSTTTNSTSNNGRPPDGLGLDMHSAAASKGKGRASPRRTSSTASSVASTAMSSPSSTPATELTNVTATSSCSPSISGGHSKMASLADLPPGFQFPTTITDENGNEVRVDPEMMGDADFLQRVSHLPIVRGTLRAYELGKQSSRVVKYGADLVESSVKTISRPVINRLGTRLGERGVEQLDEFACRQLDRLEKRYPSIGRSPTTEEKLGLMAELDELERSEWHDLSEDERERRRKAFVSMRMEQREQELKSNELRQRKGKKRAESQTEGSMLSDDDRSMEDDDGKTKADGRQGSQALVLMNQQNEMRGGSDIPRSRWQSMLVEAGMTAGGISAAMSEESMKSLKYCLQWLQYATAHIEHHITILRDLMVKLNHGELDMSSTAVQNLTQIKGDVVHTIRDVVDVVGKYAGAALPEPARNSVKAFILSLPARWATVNRPAPNTVSSNYFGNSPASPSFSSAHLSAGPHAATHMQANRIMRRGASQGQLNAATTAQAANRVLTLAVESLDILRSVTVVFGESLDRAEIWVERLRVLGLQRKRQHDLAAEGDRIDALVGPFGQGGDDDERAHWEDARGTSSRSRHGSPGAESNVSMGSMKRRRVKGIASASHSPGSTVHSMRHSRTPDGGSDDEDLTETERTSAGRPALPLMFTPGSTGSTTGAQTGFSYSHSHSHNGASHNGSGPGAGTGTGAGAGRRKRNQGGKHTPHSHTPPHQSPLVISSRLSPPTTENGQTKNMAGGMQLDS